MRRVLLCTCFVLILAASLIADSNLRITDVGLHGYSGTTSAIRLIASNPSSQAQTIHLRIDASNENASTNTITTDITLSGGEQRKLELPTLWNFDVTYDKKGISARMGLTHNDGYIWSYAGAPDKGPGGDTYLYPHTQVDAQVSYWIPRGHGLQAIVSMFNLNNEVFGFYNGSERYPIQREYYSRTISGGLRWTWAEGRSEHIFLRHLGVRSGAISI